MSKSKINNMAYVNHSSYPEKNLKYKRKYNRLKRFIKNLVFENAALCDQVALMQDRTLIVKEERRFLLKKLMEHEVELENLAQEELQFNRNSVSPNYQDQNSSAKKVKKRSNSEANKSRQRSQKGSERKLAYHIPLDTTGRPIFPIELGRLTIHSLGEVVSDRPAYHTTNCIYPVGFVSTRIYSSQRDPDRKVTYTCKISDGGDFPTFEVASDSDPESAIIGTNPDVCHNILLERIYESANIRPLEHQPNGAAFFGLSNPTVLNLIQGLIRVRKCQNYKWTKFEMSHALPEIIAEENDPTLTFEALHIAIYRSAYHGDQEIKEEPPDELLEPDNL